MSKEREKRKISAGCTTYKNFHIIDDSITDDLGIDKFFFIGCKITNLTITGSKSLTRLLFVNCQITCLEIRGSRIPNMQFINCQIDNSKFIDSTLQGTIFSNHLSDKCNVFPGSALFRGEDFPERSVSSLRTTQILFCEMNEMQIDHTDIADTDIKHCWLEKFKISTSVSMRNVDFRGTAIFNSDLGSCRFADIRFGKKKYLVELSRIFWKLKYYRRFHKPNDRRNQLSYSKREQIEKVAYYNIFKKRKQKRERKKKYMVPGAVFDYFSSTHVDTTSYEKANYLEGPDFYWHLNELEYFQNFEKKSPLIFLAIYIFTNYTRSVGTFITAAFIYVLIFAGLYCCFGGFTLETVLINLQFPIDIGFFDAFSISVKSFFNLEISPFQVINNTLTEVIFIIERLLGYFALAGLAGIFSDIIYKRKFLPPPKEPDK